MFNFFPYTNFHRLNADWILKQIKEWETRMAGYAETVTAAVSDLMSVVKTVPQAFTEPEKAQARENIGAASQSSVETLAPIPGQVQALTGTVNTHSSQILGLQNSVTTLDSRVNTNSSNIETLISQTASQGSQITSLQSSVTQLRTDVDAIVQPVVVTLSYANGTYELSMSVTDICQLLADGEQPVIINAQAVDSYPNMPLSSTAVRDVQLSSIKSDAIGNVDGFEAYCTLAQGTAQETRLMVRASAQEPDLIEVSFLRIPIGGGVEPVTVTVNTSTNTWSGATWEQFYTAFQHGCAFVNDGTNKHLCVRAANVSNVTIVFTEPEFRSIPERVSIDSIVIVSNGALEIQSVVVKAAPLIP